MDSQLNSTRNTKRSWYHSFWNDSKQLKRKNSSLAHFMKIASSWYQNQEETQQRGAVYPSDKGLISRIYKELKQIYKKKKKQTSPFISGQRIWTDTSQKETFMQPANIWIKAHHHWPLEKCKSKPQWDISCQLEWQSLKNWETTDAGEDVEK